MSNNPVKERSVLPPEYQNFFEQHYKDSREGKGIGNFLSQLMESWMHKVIARSKFDNNTVLETGAGNLNQLKYEISAKPAYEHILNLPDVMEYAIKLRR